jgi:thiamine transport system substrate-binding protein
MKEKVSKLLYMVMFVLIIAACAPTKPPETPGGPTTYPADIPADPYPAPGGSGQKLYVMVHDSFAISEGVKAAFEKQNNTNLIFIKSGDVGVALNKAILTKDSPQADVFYGVDNTFLSRAVQAGIYDPYASPLLSKIPEEFKLDPHNGALPVDYGDVCINYDKSIIGPKLPVPQSLDDLLKPDYKGQLVVENPATSSPGLAFLLATVSYFGPDKYLDFWRGLKANGVEIVDSWETAYNTNFSAAAGKGSQSMVVSYGSSPAAEVVYASPPVTESPTASIVAPGTCFRQIEFVGILKGTKNRVLAEKFVDFMLSVPFQQDMPLQMFVFPVNPEAKLPDVFTQNVQVPEKPVQMNPDEIASNRQTWINAWTQVMLR